MSDNKGHILVVDDEENWRKQLSKILHDYHVDVAADYEQALHKLSNKNYHLATFDIRLEDSDIANIQGMELLRGLEDIGLSETLKIIIISGYGNTIQMREAFHDFNVVDFIDKNEFDKGEFLDHVKKAFDEEIRANFDLKIDLEGGLAYEHLANSIKIEGKAVNDSEHIVTRVIDEIKDLFFKLFYKAQSIVVYPMGAVGYTSGLSGSIVVKVEPYYSNYIGQKVVVKLGAAKDINLEVSNFEKYVKGVIGGGRSTTTLENCYTALLGGVVYSVAGSSGEEIQDFPSYYASNSVEDIEILLDNLFMETCREWYRNQISQEHFNIAEKYRKTMGLTPARIEKVLRDRFREYLNQPEIEFKEIKDIRFSNPVYAAKDVNLQDRAVPYITHGDLNVGNILIDRSGSTWLIDFYRTGGGHILRDVVELESDLKFNLLNTSSLIERFELEKVLIKPNSYKEAGELVYKNDNDNLVKCFLSVRKLRQIAGELMKFSDGNTRQYDIALLFFSLKVTTFYRLPKVNRQHALIAASLLCDKLGLKPM